ncbi:hypothetical protein D3C86_1640510 [compost metagenome]
MPIVLARYSRIKIFACSILCLGLMMVLAWLLIEVLQGRYHGRRDPAVTIWFVASALIAGAPLVAVSLTHLVKSMVEQKVLFVERDLLIVRGLRNAALLLDRVSSVYTTPNDPGRVVIEDVDKNRYFIRSTLMTEQASKIMASVEAFLASRRTAVV